MNGWPVPDIEVLTLPEVAARMGVSSETLRRQVNRGRFPARPNGLPGVVRTPGGRLRFHVDVVDLHWPTK